MRDWWYEVVEKKLTDNRQLIKLEAMDEKLDKILVLQNQPSVEDLKPILRDWFETEVLNPMTAGTALTTASGIVNIPLKTAEFIGKGQGLPQKSPWELEYKEPKEDFSA